MPLPRSVGGDGKGEQRQSWERRKNKSSEAEEVKEENKKSIGRPLKEEGTEEEKRKREKRREQALRRKEKGAGPKGRPMR